MVILCDGKQIIQNFKFNTTNEDDFDSKEIQTSTNSTILMKMHNLLELLRNQPYKWSRHLSFYSMPLCLSVLFEEQPLHKFQLPYKGHEEEFSGCELW